MDPDKIWSKAVERGLVREDERDSYTLADILMLTCEPGFSTAEVATPVSGRGVGMDVVKGKIEYLGGSVAIHSTPGVGSEIVLTLPLTLAIIQALLFGCADQVYALPLSAVSEVLSRDDVKLKTVDGQPVAVLRDGDVAPLFRLDEVVGAAERRGRMPDGARSYRLDGKWRYSARTRGGEARRPSGDRDQAPVASFQKPKGTGWRNGSWRWARGAHPRSADIFEMGV